MEQEKRFNKNGIYSKKIRAGKRRTYFFDVRTTRSNDYYLTITESKKRFQEDGYERHKLHLYKEDFNKFVDALQETVDHIKSELMPEYDFDEYTRKGKKRYPQNQDSYDGMKNEAFPKKENNSPPPPPQTDEITNEEDLKWE